ncbi:MAG: peroxisomal membrane protein pex14 [Bathelium mastoideum]|nr:MAG: peroxisomal membrane protein pex14 [Bathelium mastoideum]KAI9688667.1 MAG: peroxisomal membrane protein pex14 [Bathelium mastoideum]
MVREDLISSAVSFLQDPSVASAPLEKRIAFLQSKNLTQEEIDISIGRAAEDASQTSTATPSAASNSGYAYPPPPVRQAPPYGPYQGGYWPPPPPPEPPRRDWRDWFIMATVMGGVGYGLYFVAKRYITPLIAPPTPPQLTADKAAVDADFARAFALLDQLAADTATLRAAEDARTTRLDTALGELESALAELREGGRRRDEDSRRLGDEVRALKDLVPRALEAQGKEREERMRELGGELRSLKTLVGNRMSGSASGVGGAMASVQGGGAGGGGMAGRVGSGVGGQGSTVAGGGGGAAGGSGVGIGAAMSSGQGQHQQQASTAGSASAGSAGGSALEEGRANSLSSVPDRTSTVSPFSRFSGRAAIPAWQMEAAKKNQEGGEKKDTSESGTMAEPTAA